MKRWLLLFLLLPAIVYGQAVQTLQYGIYVPRGVWAAGDSSKLIFQDTTLAVSGKRVIEGSLLGDQWNCVNPTLAGTTYRCDGSFERFRELEKLTSLHTTRNAAAVADSGNLHPAEFRAQITTAGDSLVITDVLTGKIYAVVVKGANNACGNSAFADVDFDDGVYTLATAGGVCQIDLLADAIWFYSTSGVGKYQGNFQTRNSALGTTTYNAAPAIVSNTVSSVSAIRDPSGKRDGLGRLALWWMMTSSAAAGQSVYNPWTNGIYDEGSAVISQWGALSPRGEMIYDHDNGTIHVAWGYRQSIFSIGADGFAESDLFRNDQSSGFDMAWTNAAVTSRFAFAQNASVVGTGASVLVAPSTEGAYFVHLAPNNNANAVKIRLTNSTNGPPEFGNTVFAADFGAVYSTGSSAADVSPYANNLVARASSGHNRVNGIVGRADSLTASAYWDRFSDSDFNMGTSSFSFCIWFKSHSASNPASGLYLMEAYTNPDYYLMILNTSGQINWQISDDNDATRDNVTTSADFFDAQWHCACGVKEGITNLYLYVDGLLAGSAAISAATAAIDPSAFRIGEGLSTTGRYFTGTVEDATMYKGYALTAKDAKWIHNRGLAGQQSTVDVDDALHALDVDYVQTLGTFAATGDEDSCQVWDAVLGIPLNNRRYASPLGNIQDAALRSVGGDSLGITLVTATRTQQIVPDVRMLDLASRTFPFVQPGIGETVVVDSAGIAGIFWAANDAFAAAKNARRGEVYLTAGTQPVSQVLSQDSLKVECAGRKTIFDGGNASIGLSITGSHNFVYDCGAKTTIGGSGGFDAWSITGTNNNLNNVFSPGSDDDGILINGAENQVNESWFYSADDEGAQIGANGDNSIFSNNHVKDQGGTSLLLDAGGDQTVTEDNRLDGAASDGSTGNVGITLAANNVTAY